LIRCSCRLCGLNESNEEQRNAHGEMFHPLPHGLLKQPRFIRVSIIHRLAASAATFCIDRNFGLEW
jgi:hypothetical protein